VGEVDPREGAGRELWRAESKEPRAAFPAGKEPLQTGYFYRWEVTDQDFRPVASGEFMVATGSELDQLKELKELAASSDRGDRWAAALAYRRIGAYDQAIPTLERLVKEVPEERSYRQGLAALSMLAGRPLEVPVGKRSVGRRRSRRREGSGPRRRWPAILSPRDRRMPRSKQRPCPSS
jgi:hypothetical protein